MNPLLVMLLSVHLLQTNIHIGVVDRIEGDRVVILLEEVGEEIIIEKSEQLEEDKWFLLYWKENDPLILKPLSAREAESKMKIKQLLDKLRNKNPAYYPLINAPTAPA